MSIRTIFITALPVVCLVTVPTALLSQQTPGSANGTQASQLPLSGRTGQNGSVTAQQSPVPGTTQSVNTLNSTVNIQGPYSQSTLNITALAGPLTLREAIQRAVTYNLGTIGQNNASLQARGQMTVARSALLPNLNGTFREVLQRTNLASQGLRVPLIPQIVGPYNYFDLRAALTQNLFDFTALRNYRSAQENLKAAEMSANDARDLVVLAVGGAYLQVIAAGAREKSARVQVKTARAVYEQTQQRQAVGLNAQIDVDRNLVEYQTQQQKLVTLQNDLAKQKINLARIIGISPDEDIALADSLPYSPAPTLSYADAVRAALTTRADLKEADFALRSAQSAHSAAIAERLPSVSVSADYGANGVNPAQSYGTYNVTGTVRVPIWQGGKTKGDIEQAQAALNQRRAERSEIEGRIESEVKSAFLDLAATEAQYRLSESNRKVSDENLALTRQRLDAGIADSVEVTRALDTSATSELDLITSLFSFNLAKLNLSRSLGDAETKVLQYLNLP